MQLFTRTLNEKMLSSCIMGNVGSTVFAVSPTLTIKNDLKTSKMTDCFLGIYFIETVCVHCKLKASLTDRSGVHVTEGKNQ